MFSEEGDALVPWFKLLLALGHRVVRTAAMLMRMYLMWGENKASKSKNSITKDALRIKTVTLEIDGILPLGAEGGKGVHRLVRISPFDSNAKRHTPFVSRVYPLVTTVLRLLSIPQTSLGRPWIKRSGGQSVTRLKWLFACGTLLRIIIENLKRVPNWKIKSVMQLLKIQLYE